MAISFPCGSVTSAGWNVSCTTGDGYPKGGRLSVFKGFVHHKDKKGFPIARKGDHDGRAFGDESEYESFVRSRGYVRPFFRSVAGFKSKNRSAIRLITIQVIIPAIMAARSHNDIVTIADGYKAKVRAMGCDILDSLCFANGVYCAARRLRRDLYRDDNGHRGVENVEPA